MTFQVPTESHHEFGLRTIQGMYYNATIFLFWYKCRIQWSLFSLRRNALGHDNYIVSYWQSWGSVTFWYRSGCGSGSSDLYLWLTDPERIREAQKRTVPTGPIRMREHWYPTFTSFFRDKAIKKFQNSRNQAFSYYGIFAWWWKDPEPVLDPHLWLTDPDADQGGPKTFGFGSGFGSESRTPWPA